LIEDWKGTYGHFQRTTEESAISKKDKHKSNSYVDPFKEMKKIRKNNAASIKNQSQTP
jgi:hypothetical protein